MQSDHVNTAYWNAVARKQYNGRIHNSNCPEQHCTVLEGVPAQWKRAWERHHTFPWSQDVRNLISLWATRFPGIRKGNFITMATQEIPIMCDICPAVLWQFLADIYHGYTARHVCKLQKNAAVQRNTQETMAQAASHSYDVCWKKTLVDTITVCGNSQTKANVYKSSVCKIHWDAYEWCVPFNLSDSIMIGTMKLSRGPSIRLSTSSVAKSVNTLHCTSGMKPPAYRSRGN